MIELQLSMPLVAHRWNCHTCNQRLKFSTELCVLFTFLAWKAFGLKLCVNFYYGPSSFPIIKMKHIAQCKYTKIFDRKKGEASHPFQLPPPTPLPWIFDQPLPGCCYVYPLNMEKFDFCRLSTAPSVSLGPLQFLGCYILSLLVRP